MKLLHLETITFSDAKLSYINLVLCYVLSHYVLKLLHLETITFSDATLSEINVVLFCHSNGRCNSLNTSECILLRYPVRYRINCRLPGYNDNFLSLYFYVFIPAFLLPVL